MHYRPLILSSILLLALSNPEATAEVHTVTNLNDSGPGSLRDAISGTSPGDTVEFSAELPGSRIVLGGSELLLDKAITVDASNLPGGMTIDASEISRVLSASALSGYPLSGFAATQSSGESPASNAIDGDPATRSSTADGDITPWWEIDFGNDLPIDRVVLHNRQDCCEDLFQNLGVTIYDELGTVIYDSGTLNPNNVLGSPEFIAVAIPKLLNARRIRVAKDGPSLSLGEFEVFGGVHLDSLTITGGLTSAESANPNNTGAGGGIYNSGNLRLRNCKISGNRTGSTTDPGGVVGPGGGIYHQDGILSIDRCTVSGNAAGDGADSGAEGATGGTGGWGGGLFQASGGLHIVDSGFSDNRAGSGGLADTQGYGGSGGGLYLEGGATTIEDSIFTNNHSGLGAEARGGGIFNSAPSPVLRGCSFRDNIASSSGGAMANFDSSPTLDRCYFLNNRADFGGALTNESPSSPMIADCQFQGNSANYDGGAIYNHAQAATGLVNSSFLGNQATDRGGAIYNLSSSFSSTNCTIVGNRADGRGGAIFTAFSDPSFANTIMWGNTVGGAPNSLESFIASPGVSHCLIEGLNPDGTNNLDGTDANNDPLISLEANPTSAAGIRLRLLAGSAAIDAGDSTANFLASDIVGNERIQDGIIDLGSSEGAIEIDQTLASTWQTDPDDDGSPYGIELALGTDPISPDRNESSKLAAPALNSDGYPTLTFPISAAALQFTSWVVKRSTDLVSFTEIYRFDGPTQLETHQVIEITSSRVGDTITITDASPHSGEVSYRFEAQLVAP
ncbi:MAG: discoidin domain-containing protein [Verrucomicrobiales bacterium]